MELLTCNSTFVKSERQLINMKFKFLKEISINIGTTKFKNIELLRSIEFMLY